MLLVRMNVLRSELDRVSDWPLLMPAIMSSVGLMMDFGWATRATNAADGVADVELS